MNWGTVPSACGRMSGKWFQNAIQAISITEVKNQCYLKAFNIILGIYSTTDAVGLKLLQLRSHSSKINFGRQKNADVHTKAGLSLWQ